MLLTMVGTLGLLGCDQYRQDREAAEVALSTKSLEDTKARQEANERVAKEEAEELRVQCVGKINQLITLANNSVKNNDPGHAIRILSPCRELMVKPEAKATYARADKALDFKIKREATDERKAVAEKKKKKEGVRLGMSPEDIIASSWGKPERVNRSVNHYGVREQWVYEGGGYLYFVNDVLDSIQN